MTAQIQTANDWAELHQQIHNSYWTLFSEPVIRDQFDVHVRDTQTQDFLSVLHSRTKVFLTDSGDLSLCSCLHYAYLCFPLYFLCIAWISCVSSFLTHPPSSWPPSGPSAPARTKAKQRSTGHQIMSNKLLVGRCEVTWLSVTLQTLIRQNKSAGVKKRTVCKFCMTCNLGTIKPISPPVLMRCAVEVVFYGCNFPLMFPLVTLSCCMWLHGANEGLLLLTGSTCY